MEPSPASADRRAWDAGARPTVSPPGDRDRHPRPGRTPSSTTPQPQRGPAGRTCGRGWAFMNAGRHPPRRQTKGSDSPC